LKDRKMHIHSKIGHKIGWAAAAAAMLLLTACGTADSASNAADPTGSGSDTTSPAASGPIEISDDRGTVTLDEPATRVVGLEWGLIEDLSALGVELVGAADVKQYNTYNQVQPIDPDTPDVGTRDAPSVDAIAALDPDLIVTTTSLPKPVVKQLESQAPVLVFRGSDGKDPIGYMENLLNTLATATGTEDKAAELIEDFNTSVEEGKQALADASKTGAPFLYADGWEDSGTVTIRLYTPSSFIGAVAAELGLENQWTKGGDPDYGLVYTDVEGLVNVENPDTTWLYTSSDEMGDVFQNQLMENDIWTGFSWVERGDMHRLPNGIWPYGGPPAAGAYVDAMVEALTA
jgi:iron complex transport system substrate-binding protein